MPLKMSREEIRAIYRQGEEAVIALVEMLIERLNIRNYSGGFRQ